jgi:selenium metabolism protein YedF
MAVTIDARGLPCPQPVIRTKNAMREANKVITLVSATDQVSNVQRLAERAGWQVQVERHEGGYAIHMTKGAATVEPQISPDVATCAMPRPTVVVVPCDYMGRGDVELGTILVRAFFHTLTEVEPLPNTIVFYNAGVKLAVEGSPILDDLRALEAKGVSILACGTCLGYYNLKERLGVGVISNMYTIAELLLDADHTITL